jgi:hypothetical protein
LHLKKITVDMVLYKTDKQTYTHTHTHTQNYVSDIPPLTKPSKIQWSTEEEGGVPTPPLEIPKF